MALRNKTFTTQLYRAEYSVDEEQVGLRLDQFCQIYLESFSREDVKKKIKVGDIKILDRPGKNRPHSRLLFRDIVIIETKKTTHEDEYWQGELVQLKEKPEIVFEDDNIIVISKPPFMSTHPTGKHIFYCATVYFEMIYGHTIHSIHRLDRETSGILLLGKNPKASAILTDHFEKELVRKCYFFMAKPKRLVKEGDEFSADERLGATEEGLKRVYIHHFPIDSIHGKKAFTHFKILRVEGDYCLGLAFPKTGRQHQIRVHAMIRDIPLIGDKLYLGSFEMFQRFKDNLASREDHQLMELPRHALHSIALKIPYQGKDQIFQAPIPHDFIPWITKNFTCSLDEIEQMIKLQINEYFSKN
ncbi:MAG: RluA family pseudouridine synthase [Halobacteriovoraceae bacterium]|nr:RluA family pseudouridine synthase [Halobacteriovoraceae bacterium]